MKRFLKPIALATLGFTTTFGSFTQVEACPGGGRTTYRTTTTRVYYRPVQPTCSVPAAQPRLIVQPPQQPYAGQQVAQPVQGQQFAGQQGFPGQQPMQGQQFAGQQLPGQQVQGQQLPGQQVQGQQFAGQQTQFQGQPGQRPQAGFAGQPQGQGVAPQGQQQLPQQAPQQFAGQQGQQAPPQSQPQQPQQQPQQQPAAPSLNGAQQSALQMLSQFGGSTPAPAVSAPVPQAESRVGTWVASLPNQATVQLTLGADGGFSWVATANGKTSTFAGTYNLNEGSLTLERSNDKQQLAGSLSEADANSFIFKLNGQTEGLKFARR